MKGSPRKKESTYTLSFHPPGLFPSKLGWTSSLTGCSYSSL